jgi:HAD superfamily phosphatase (TIGR01668 family)
VQANGAVVIHVAIYLDQPDPFSGLKIDRVFPSRGSPNGKIPTTTQMHVSILFHLTTYIRGFCHHIHTSTMTLISQCMIDMLCYCSAMHGSTTLFRCTGGQGVTQGLFVSFTSKRHNHRHHTTIRASMNQICSVSSDTTDQEEQSAIRKGWQYMTQSVNLRGVADFVSLYAKTYTRSSREDSSSSSSSIEHQNNNMNIETTALVLPHIETADLRNIDWVELKEKKQYKGVVFDKDHTLTLPYDMKLHPFAKESLEQCISVFGKDNVVLYSNSAGLRQFDPDGHHAMVLEHALGIAVFRHTDKKPHVSASTVKELEDYFGCDTGNLIMVGDRYMTDIVFGNRLGMLTIRPMPFPEVEGSKHREPMTVRLSRRMEEILVRRCRTQGMLPPTSSSSS